MSAKHDYRFFEQWARQNGMLPVVRIEDVTVNGRPVGDILIADSGAMLSHHEFPNEEHDLPFFFRTGYAIDRPGDKTWLAAFCDYPADAFAEYAGDSRRQARIDECVRAATLMIEQTQQAGLYNGSSTQHPRPH